MIRNKLNSSRSLNPFRGILPSRMDDMVYIYELYCWIYKRVRSLAGPQQLFGVVLHMFSLLFHDRAFSSQTIYLFRLDRHCIVVYNMLVPSSLLVILLLFFPCSVHMPIFRRPFCDYSPQSIAFSCTTTEVSYYLYKFTYLS